MGERGTARRVFCSHRSVDKPAVLALAEELRARGIDAWVDQQEIGGRDDLVAAIDRGLEQCDVGLIFVSATTGQSKWVRAEVSYLVYARIEEGKPLIPVQIGEDPWVPPLLRPLARVPIEDVDRLVEAIENRGTPPPLGKRRPETRVHRFEISVDHEGGELELRARLDDHEIAALDSVPVPQTLVAAVEAFSRGDFLRGLRRGPDDAVAATVEQRISDLGRDLWRLLLPDPVGETLVELLEGSAAQVGAEVELRLVSDDPWVLGLPVDALRAPGGALLARSPSLSTLRLPRSVPEAGSRDPLAGPLKVLVAVAAPDETRTENPVLDLERELQNILDAVEDEQLRQEAEVQILEVGHEDPISAALRRDQHHVLHLSCHGGPGVLELETEEGDPHPVAAEELASALRAAGRPLPLVFLSACHGARPAGEAASVAETLLRAGVPAVVATLGPIGDFYATELSREFYSALASDERPRASLSLIHI